jgi:hypothetical protein
VAREGSLPANVVRGSAVGKRTRSPRRRRLAIALALLAPALAISAVAMTGAVTRQRLTDAAARAYRATVVLGDPPPTRIGINLTGVAPFNRQQVFTNLVAQSEWFVSSGKGWAPAPANQLDRHGELAFLRPGEVAHRPLMLPPPLVGTVAIRCSFAGQARLSAGGIAQLVTQAPGSVDLVLTGTGEPDEGAWVQVEATASEDPLRRLDCRARSAPRDQVFDPRFVATLRDFTAVRFLDWQRTNDDPPGRWSLRTLPDSASQATLDGVAIEHMVRLANEARVDPWFLMPYNADEAYIAGFAAYVRDHLAAGRTVYVELGNEVWNDMFVAAQQARAEGLAMGLAPADDPFRAQMRRYARKSRTALAIWTRAFAREPHRLVRVVSTINAYPDAAAMILGYEDVARWTDALAVAPYIHLDLDGRSARDVDWVFARMDAAIAETLDAAVANRRTAAAYNKRLIAYEGGQHLVTRDLALARAVQRDPRMEGVYRRYLEQWRDRVGDRLMLYASTAPISEHGSWGLREYAGQPLAETPKLRAVRRFRGQR